MSTDASPDRPLVSPSPRAPKAVPSPKGSPSGAGGSRDTARGDTGAARGSASEGLGVRPGSGGDFAVSACVTCARARS
ncbi:hypothetical protein [Streptomyces shaanxiensis]